jgi:enoyl-CoA hydratase/carnithine racemase
MPTPETIIYNKRGPVADIQLNRPHVHNAFNTAMRDDLYQALEAARDDPEVGSILLSGIGKSFCAGADLTEFGTAPSVVAARDARWSRDLWGLFLDLDKPLVAAIHGHCIGSGLEMAMLCDLRIAADNALFAMPEVKLGLIPAAGGTQTLPRFLGTSSGLHLLLTGEPVNAQEALALGMVIRVVQKDRLTEESMRLARHLSTLDRCVVKTLKEAVWRGGDMPLDLALEMETRLALKLLRSQGGGRPF